MKRQPTEAQKQAAQERRAKVRALAKSIAAMPEGERAALAARVSVMTIEGRSLSLHNQLMIALQLPRATIVGGFRQWIKAGRAVRKGEHGAAIWCKAGARKVDGATPGADEDDAGAGAADDNRFVIGTVFDVSQTDEIGAPVAVVSPEVAKAFGMEHLPNTRVVDDDSDDHTSVEYTGHNADCARVAPSQLQLI